MSVKKDFYDCEKEVLNLYLNAEIFNKKRLFTTLNNTPHHRINHDNENIHGIEMIIRPECNQKCEYCYIARYGDSLYPHNERADSATILKNIDMFLDYMFNTRKVYWEHFELFAGDLFYDNIFFDILDIFYKYLKPLSERYPRIFEANEGLILMPTNFSFIDDDAKAQRVDEYITKFRTELNWDIGLSISTDGKYAVDTREMRPVDDEHFDKLFKFTLKYPRVGFHPIISVSNVKNAIKNYDWWKTMYNHYYNNDERGWESFDFLPYWLEARNDEWTPEAIEDFCHLMKYMVDDRFKMHGEDPEKLAYHMYVGDGQNDTIRRMYHSDIIDIRLNVDDLSYERIGCSLNGLFCLNMGNLEMSPCHRLTYHQFRGGRFIHENDKITDVEPENVFGFINIVTAPADAIPQCERCMYRHICTRGCLGAQFEATGEVFQPCVTVCDLFKTYFGFLVEYYDQLGVLDAALRNGWITERDMRIYNGIKEYYTELCRRKDIEEKRFQ